MAAQSQYQTPGVYVVEESGFPSSIIAVPTAVPVFVGYTEVALNGSQSLTNVAVPISSMADFSRYYGGAPKPLFAYVSDATRTPPYEQDPAKLRFCMFYSLQLFFNNGGGECYIMSIGSYAQANLDAPAQADYSAAWPRLDQCAEPSILVMPDATLLNYDDWRAVSLAALQHCAAMQNRVVIFDVWKGYTASNGGPGDPISGDNGSGGFYPIGALGDNFNKFGVAYFPWLNTDIVSDSAIDYTWLTAASLGQLATDLLAEAPSLFPNTPAGQAQLQTYTKDTIPRVNAPDPLGQAAVADTQRALYALSPRYRRTMAAIATSVNLLPPSGAMAGVYANNDNTFGVSHAPANTGIVSAISPSVAISDDDQEKLNTPLNGIAVNAIRTFPDRGLLVWGARTMAGNSDDWRYINVRRTIIMLEQSIKQAMHAFVFQANDQLTWQAISSTIDNFLNTQWKAGALVGPTAGAAYSIAVGLGSTMTGEDILQGYLRVSVKLAVVHPAEFIVLTFQQQMQVS
jgi:phage tail sheath protein FI